MRNGRQHRAGSVIDDDVRSSLDLLDGVIGEFDDGLTSSAESEANYRRTGHGRTNQRRADGRLANQKREDKVKPELRSSHLSINEQIDDIFSQLTEEIYLDEKKIKENKIKLSRSPTRNRNDPLPPPPVSSHPPSSSKHPPSTSTHPPPIDRKKKPGPSSKTTNLSSKYRSPDNKTLTNDKPRTKTGASKHQDKSSSLPLDRIKNGSGGGEVVLYQDHDFSNNTIEKVVADVHKTADYSKRSSQAPPPMPEKQRIHLKNSIDRNRDTSKSFAERQKSSNISSQEAAVMEELKAKVSDKQGKISKFDNNRPRGRSKQRDDAGNIRPGKKVQSSGRVASPQSNSSQKSGVYVSMTDGRGHHPGAAERRINHHRDDYRRSRSMGPLETRDQLRSSSRGYSPDRSRDNTRDSRHVKSRQLNTPDRTRSKSRTSRHESFNVEDRRGRSQTRESRDRTRDKSRGHLMSPPSPAEAEETIAKLLPRYPQGLPPERQRSMIDLRVMEEVRKNQRRSMAVGPLEDLPPHLRNHLMPAAYRNGIRGNIPQHLDEQLRFQHQMNIEAQRLGNIEAQREQLVGRGFPITHPLVSGEIPLHPELMGQLHFEIPSRTTLPLGPDDYRRFLPEMSRRGMQSAFPYSHQRSDVTTENEKNRVSRQMSKRENSFVGVGKESKKKDKHDANNNRAKSSDNHEPNNKLFSWLNSGFGGKQKDENHRNHQLDQQWIMRERDDMKSMPPVHISDEYDNKMRGQHNSHLGDRNDKSRASFGMILKDKFQKNPNMYFPDTRDGRSPSKSSEFIEHGSGVHHKSKIADNLSDTDTLIHNMSEGSFEKESLSGGHSIGSNKSSRSSGKSSSVSHDSMDGTPRMIRRSESITTPKTPANTSFIIPTNPSVILNKKTIRNYVPTESNNMLRSFEDNRKSNPHHSVTDSREKSSVSRQTERKSSVDKLIDDFHRNLPSPPPSARTNTEHNNDNSLPFSDGDSMFSGLNNDESRTRNLTNEKPFRAGTVTSQTSHWSVASSVASFDYHSVNSMENKVKKVNSDTKRKEQQLPSLDEVDVGERIPPEGAAAESPHNTVTVKKVNLNNNNKTNEAKHASNHKNNVREAVGDLMKETEGDDDLHMLRKLISEGRISGINEKPPPFVPPTPPAKQSKHAPKKPNEGQAGSSKNNEEKNKKTTEQKHLKQQFSQATKSGDRPRKSRDAPKPPTLTPGGGIGPGQEIQGASSADIKFIAGRRINSVESINDDTADTGNKRGGGRGGGRRGESDGIKRSTSMHVPREPREDTNKTEDAALAQLIADSTEKRFKINNLFKVKWKKKNYSFDLN